VPGHLPASSLARTIGRAGSIPAPSCPVRPTFLEESETPAPQTGAQELLN